MDICVVGLWHLGLVTAACMAKIGHNVTGYNADKSIVEKLQSGEMPVFEPGLEDLIRAGVDSGNLRFSAEPTAVAQADIVWVAYDTPVDDNDVADVDFVVNEVTRLLPHLKQDALILISSQLPVGTTARLEAVYHTVQPNGSATFAYSPENLRLGNAIRVFMEPDRVIVGVRNEADKARISEALQPITSKIEWMSVESAEMTKHALNAFLATSVAFMNEIATLCEQVGADAREVERGLKTEARIGPRAYLRPGGAFAGGTLARDLIFLSQSGSDHQLELPLINGVFQSNLAHKSWAYRRLRNFLGDLSGKTILLLGLTYKPNTSTLRRSSAMELCEQLVKDGAHVRAIDPQAEELPAHLAHQVTRFSTLPDALAQADAAVVTTEWPEFRQLNSADCQKLMKRALILDANSFLASQLAELPEYYAVGKP